MKKKSKRKLKGWVWLLIGFMLGLVYSNKFIYSDLIAKAEANKKVAMVQLDQEELKTPQNENKGEIKEDVKKAIEEKKEESQENICNYDSVTCLIKNTADNYNINWKLAVAISKHETGVYTSVAFKEKNNVGGNFRNGSLMTFSSLNEGIDFFVRNLKNNYIDMGLTSIETIRPKYAPVGATNDPNNLNSYWVNGVTKYYNELEAK